MRFPPKKVNKAEVLDEIQVRGAVNSRLTKGLCANSLL